MPVDVDASGGDGDGGWAEPGEEVDGLESAGEGEEGSAADEEAEFGGGVGVEDGGDDEACAEDRHATRDGDGGPLAAGEAAGEAHLEERLAGGVDAGAGVVDEFDLGVVAVGLSEAREPVFFGGADGERRGRRGGFGAGFVRFCGGRRSRLAQRRGAPSSRQGRSGRHGGVYLLPSVTLQPLSPEAAARPKCHRRG